MDTHKKILGIIFAILFISTAVPALFIINFDRRAFTAETYQRAFTKDDFYGKLPGIMAEALVSINTNQIQFPIVMRGMSQNDWEAFFRTLLPQETLRVMGNDVLNSTFAYVNMKTDSVQLSLIPLKASMVSDSGVQAVYKLLDKQPDCTFIQVAQMTIDLLSKSEMQFCKPPEDLYPLLTPVIQVQMQFVAQAIPDNFTLIRAAPENDPRIRLRSTRLMMRLSPILPLTFLLLMTISVVNSLKSWLSWWGIPFSVTGTLASLMSMSGVPIFGMAFQRILANRMPAYLPTILLDYTSDLASEMLKTILRPVLWQGLFLALIGLMMAMVSYFIHQKEINSINEGKKPN